ncbi:MAG TPA: hypothetical protein VFX95_04275 [Caulobacteraceae bacterium]|nr:hypothetical protein [Caulobacteraceae bacterium]
MAEIEYSIAWKRNDPRVIAGATVFWRGLGLSDEIIKERVPELCNVAWSGGKVVGVTTVKLGDAPPVKCRVGFLRCAVASEFRKHYLATFLTRDSLTILEHWSLENPRARVQGLAFIIEAIELGSKAVFPMWADWNLHYNLIGHTSRDEQIRLAWFRHARLD